MQETPMVGRHVWHKPNSPRCKPNKRRRKRRRFLRLVRLIACFCMLLFTGTLMCWVLLPSIASIVELIPFPTFLMRSTQTILSVEYLGQEDYPTGCESVTAVMALNHADFNITVDDFINNCLPQGDFWIEQGQAYGDDPYECFVGDPYSSSGFGCFAPALLKGLTKVAGEENVLDLSGSTLKQLCRNYIDHGIPVIVWATIGMKDPVPGRSWILVDSGETFTWTAGEHCLLLVGYDKDNYYFNDPYNGQGLTAYDKQLVDTRYEQMGRQALAIK